MKPARHALSAVVLVWTFVAIAIAQQTLIVDVNLTLLTVRVRDSQGQPVINLTARDFEILEDGRLRPASHFSIQRQSTAIGLLVDRSISVDAARNAVVANVVRICNALRPNDQAFLMTFSTGTKTDVSLTGDATAIISAIHHVRAAAGTRLYDAMIDALDELSVSNRERKALIVLTDGADHYSTHTLQQVIDVARLYGAEIDVIAYRGDDSRNWTSAGRAQISSELEKMVSATGGQLLSSSNGSETAMTIERMVDSLHDAYQLGFYTSTWSGESPNVEIRIRNRPQLTVFPAAARISFEK